MSSGVSSIQANSSRHEWDIGADSQVSARINDPNFVYELAFRTENTELAITRHIARLEYSVCKWAAFPILGTFVGVARMILGVIQTIGALISLIGSVPFLWHQRGLKIAYIAGSHLINGSANIVAGAFEAIPIVGSIIYWIRENRNLAGGAWVETRDFISDGRIVTGQSHMLFVGYKILEENPIGYICNEDLREFPRLLTNEEQASYARRNDLQSAGRITALRLGILQELDLSDRVSPLMLV